MILCIVIAMDFPVKVLVISGSMGSGKTTVLGEASDILTASNIAHVALDLDVPARARGAGIALIRSRFHFSFSSQVWPTRSWPKL